MSNDQNVKCITLMMRIEAISFLICNVLKESLKITSLSPHNLGIQRRLLFALTTSQDTLLAKSLLTSKIV